MSIREVDIAEFSNFARQQIEANGGEVSLTSLAEQWERHQKSAPAAELFRHPSPQVAEARVLVDELAREQGVTRISTVDELRFPFLDSEEEVDDFLTAVKVGRSEDRPTDPLND